MKLKITQQDVINKDLHIISTASFTTSNGIHYVLGNACWNFKTNSGHPVPTYETSVTAVDKGADGKYFFILQHDWEDFEAANEIIAKALNKGWGKDRICKILEYLK